MVVAKRAKDTIEHGLVRTPFFSSGLKKGLRIFVGNLAIRRRLFVATGVDERDEKTLKVTGSVADDVRLQIPFQIFFVGGFDLGDLGVGSRTEDLDEAAFVGAQTLHRRAHLARVVKDGRRHQGENHAFQFAAQFGFEVVDQIASVHLFVGGDEHSALIVGNARQRLDDGFLVGARTLREVVEVGVKERVVVGVKVKERVEVGIKERVEVGEKERVGVVTTK